MQRANALSALLGPRTQQLGVPGPTASPPLFRLKGSNLS